MAEKILFVDDEKRLLKIWRYCFANDYRFDAFFASSCEEAIRLAKERKFDCFVLDLQLTEGNLAGVKLAKECRKITPDVPIILFTANSVQSYKHQFVPAVVDDVIDKMTDIESLKWIILSKIYMARFRVHAIRREPNADSIIKRGPRVIYGEKVDRPEGVDRLEGVLLKDNEPIAWDIYRYPGKNKSVLGLASCVGCVGGCKFCRSGRLQRKLKRTLSVDEVISQVIHGFQSHYAMGLLFKQEGMELNFTCEGDSIVSNMDNCCEALRRMKEWNIGLSFIMTTIGHEENLKRFAREYKDLPVEFFWSLHFPIKKERAQFMPATKNQSLEAVRDALVEASPSDLVTVAYMVVNGMNNRKEDLAAVKQLFGGYKGIQFKVSAIDVSNLDMDDPVSKELGRQITTDLEVEIFANELRDMGFPTRIRKNLAAGKEERGASCGSTVPLEIEV